ncbi:MAG: PKD domain-containing protein [Bacteroidetes bacterium]|nr:PKD domain-containing protein [Bacteroidota bacterium]
MNTKILFFTSVIHSFLLNFSNAQVGFSVNPQSGCAPLAVELTNTTVSPGAYYYNWNFGDGTPTVYDTLSTTLNHTYTVGGNFWAYLSVFDSMGYYLGDYFTTVEVYGALQQFEWSTDSACPGDEVNMGIFGAYSYAAWDFGDGSYWTGPYASHTWIDTGVYTITLVATSAQCGTTDTVQQEIYILSNVPIPDFELDIYPNPVCPGDEVSFNVQWWAENFVFYGWDYGDGNTFSSDNFWEGNRHSYTATGDYLVTLTATNGCGNSNSASDTVWVENGLPFTGNTYVNGEPESACPGDLINFYSINGMQEYFWNFGDGSSDTSTVGFNDHEYQATGDYQISVTIVNGCGSDTTVYDSVIIDNNIPVTGDMNIYTNAPGCPGDLIVFYASTEFEYTYSWNFGDGNSGTGQWVQHAFSTVGSYTVALTSTNSCGMDSVISLTIQVTNNLPVDLSDYDYGSTAESACPGDSMIFWVYPGNNTYLWDFGDGNTGSPTGTIEDAAITLHAYSALGTYYPVLTITNGCGNSASDSTVEIVIGNSTPAEFDLEVVSDSSCAGKPLEIVVFGAGNSFNWDFGDGDTAYTILPGVEHTYTNPGIYTVIMAGMNGCGNYGSDTLEVVIENCVVGIETNNGEINDLMIYPNPSAGEINIEFALPAPNTVSVSSITVTGQKISMGVNSSFGEGQNRLSFDLSDLNLPSGIYLLEIMIGKEPLHRRIVIAE